MFTFAARFARFRLAAAAVLVVGSGLAHADSTAVGEVTLTIGQSMVIPAAGAPEPLRRGSLIRQGDRIETSESGHVHLRFVDGALVSVRPTSRLVVEDYQYDAAQVARSSVRFRLEKGVTRAISGAAAEGARDRFRLNTPLVAIGVRGTDFVVRTGAEQTVAAVNQGAIVMAPFGEGCTQQGYGPCGSASSQLLSADMGGMLVEFRYAAAQPELKPFNARASESAILSAEARRPAEATPSRDSNAGTRAGNDDAVSVAVAQGAVRQAAVAVPVAAPTPIAPEAPVAAPPVAVVPPAPLPTAPALLAWGRWGAPAGATDFALNRDAAREGRQPTVGDAQFLLYRNESAGAVLPQGLGNVSFALQQGFAQFVSNAGAVQAAAVQGGNLSIDFTQRIFSTSLSLSSGATGVVGLQAGGYVRDDGLFVSRSATQAVAGAIASDGRTAGYLFERDAAGGTLSGITSWAR